MCLWLRAYAPLPEADPPGFELPYIATPGWPRRYRALSGCGYSDPLYLARNFSAADLEDMQASAWIQAIVGRCDGVCRY